MGGLPGGEALAKIADEFGNQTQGMLKSVLDQKDRLQREVEVLTGQIGKLEAQLQSLTDAVAKQQADAMNVVGVVQTAYAAKEQEIMKVFDLAIAGQAKAHEAQMAKYVADEKADRNEARSAQETLISQLEDRLEHAKRIVGIIGNIGVTGNYQKTATEESGAANLWRWITLCAFAVAVAAGGWALFLAHDTDLKLTIARMLFALLVLGVTMYTGKESARHRSNADRAKRVELELASLGSFVESLDKPRQDALREKLTSEYFGKESEPHTVAPLVDPNKLLDLLKDAIAKFGR